ncbi:beta-lactamase HcpD precursor [Sinorhizobium fredii NGR234]|uniref:Beta-lactamase HcpD n=1 Tax=Sinorhizobium fredii (strain NBRC 101917 / NGR234) TaxID=394 RepID=C3MDG1_SINFN|nr:Sel1 repeat protein [Sinorhizobium fredii]ACP25480.1 beta-lactamase HcpD precursor [Sinorhizobium fredii NGR234]
MKYRSIGLALIVASALAAGLAPAGAQESAASLDAPLALVAKHDPQAQFVIGSMYYKGSSGVRRDHAMAAKWYRTAAEQGHVKAQVNLGSLYFEGEGVPQDYVEAARWFRKAAEDGNAAMAQYNLAMIYAHGMGVVANPVEAAHWYRKAAEQGDAAAQLQLGLMYERGEGVPRDAALAADWLQKAVRELPEARQHLDRLRKN